MRVFESGLSEDSIVTVTSRPSMHKNHSICHPQIQFSYWLSEKTIQENPTASPHRVTARSGNVFHTNLMITMNKTPARSRSATISHAMVQWEALAMPSSNRLGKKGRCSLCC